MKRLLVVLLSFAMSAQAWANSSQTVNALELVQEIEENVKTNDLASFLNKASSQYNLSNQNVKLQLHSMSKFSLATGQTKLSVEILDEGIRFNGKLIKKDKNETAEEFYGKVSQAFQKKTHATNDFTILNMVHSLIFPEAHAAWFVLGFIPGWFAVTATGAAIANGEWIKKCRAYFNENNWRFDAHAKKGSHQYNIQKSHCTRKNAPYRTHADQMNAEAQAKQATRCQGRDCDYNSGRSYNQPATTYSTKTAAATTTTRQRTKRCFLFCGKRQATQKTSATELQQPVAL